MSDTDETVFTEEEINEIMKHDKKPKFSQENAESSAVELFKEAIKQSMKNPMALINESIQQDPQAILQTINSAESNDSFIHLIVTMVWQIQSTATTKVTTGAFDKMCGDFHKQELTTVLLSSSLLTDQCTLENLLRMIIAKACGSDLVFDIPDEELNSCKLSEQEKLALRYSINIKEKIEIKLTESRLVQLGLEDICYLPIEASNILLKVIIKRWVTLRLYAYTLAYICS
ncbi:unnamed protein product [Mytilus coruscus]|uniref:Uncharacterized protein n=1 Tax=Mytilus coruscus TaxID=42192 RepID=A0A6J7ZWU2_MYTCO|nr:unnamed protein product [Mytilus coruscus]